MRNRIKRSVETPIAHIVYPTSETSSDSLAFDKSSSQIVYSRPNSLNTRAPEESLPRTQGVHYIFPFSPQTKRESRQIDLNDQAEIVQENNESENTPSTNEEYKEDDVDDYEGWDYEVSVDKSVAEEFSVSKSIADMVDYITSTFAPPSTLLTTTTTETTTSQTTTSPTTTLKQKEERRGPAIQIKSFKVHNNTNNSIGSFKQSFAKNITSSKASNQNSNSVRIHPFLANRKLKAQKVSQNVPSSFNRNNFFQSRPTEVNSTVSDKPKIEKKRYINK